MALNLPDSPSLNDIYQDSTTGFSYQWDGSIWRSYRVTATTSATDLVDDASPQLGANLDLNSSSITGTGNINITGVVTATSFVKSSGTSSQFLKADGSVDSSTYITSADGGNADQLDGQEGTHYLNYNNFTNTPTIPTNNNQLTNGAGFITTSFTNTNQLTNGAGFITTSFTNTNQLTNGAGFITGTDNTTGTSGGLSGAPSITVTDITAVGNVSIAGTLTYEDVTSIDSIGIVTARTGVRVTSGGIVVSAGTVETSSYFQSDRTTGTNNVFRGQLNSADTCVIKANGSATFAGNISVSGTVDGRDVATDGSKLDGIEASATADQTASEILTAIKTVDGSGSGLDADLLDGQHGSYYSNYNNLSNKPTIPTNNNQLTNGAGYITSANGGNAATLDGIDSSQFLRSDANDTLGGVLSYTSDTARLQFTNSSYNMQLHIGGWSSSNSNNISRIRNSNGNLHIDSAANGHLYLNHYSTGTTYIRGNVVWHAGNDGSGSGLDADKLDGIQASSFLRSDAADQKTSGTLRFNDNIILSLGSGDDAEFFCNGSHLYLDLNSGIGNFYIRDGSTTRYTFDDNGSFTATGNVTAYSDIRLKENIEVIPNALEKVSAIRGVTYDRIDNEDLPRQSGVIAQEVETVLPEVVSTDEKGIKSVAYGNLVGLLIEAVKELKSEVETLKAERN